jgi:hypothetical protein
LALFTLIRGPGAISHCLKKAGELDNLQLWEAGMDQETLELAGSHGSLTPQAMLMGQDPHHLEVAAEHGIFQVRASLQRGQSLLRLTG